MAAMLIEIKSRMLLPPKKSADGKEPDDPRAELVRRLIEYEQMKLAAARLDALPLLGRDFLRAQVADRGVAGGAPAGASTRIDLRNAWHRDRQSAPSCNQHHLISREHLSVREHMSIVLRALQGRRFALFEDLFDVDRGAPVVVVTFIALLELAREHLLEVTQAEAFAPIYVRLAYQASAEPADGARQAARAQSTARTSRPPRPSDAGRQAPALPLRDRVAGDDLDRHRRRLEHAVRHRVLEHPRDRVLARRAHDDVVDARGAWRRDRSARRARRSPSASRAARRRR